jgi:hypothetical protein
MIELDFTNADTMAEDKLVFYRTVNDTDSVKIDSSAIMIQDIITTGNINANYSLTVFGNIEASNIKVLKDLICFGTIKCDSLYVTGGLKCFKNIVVNEINVADDAFIYSGMIGGGIIDGNLLVGQTIEVEEVINVSKNVFCNEGAVGNGCIKCKNIICSEYLEIDVESLGSSLLLEEIKEKTLNKNAKSTDIKEPNTDGLLKRIDKLSRDLKGRMVEINDVINDNELINLINKTKNISISLCKGLEELIYSSENDLEFEKICDLMLAASRFNPVFKEHHRLFKEILDYSETHPENDVMSFLKFVDMKRNMPGYMLKMSICQDFFEVFVNRQKNYIADMRTDSIRDQNQFVFCLSMLEKNKDEFTYDEYLMLTEKLYGVIGVKPTMVQKFISIGG